jgi:hypothetical protein
MKQRVALTREVKITIIDRTTPTSVARWALDPHEEIVVVVRAWKTTSTRCRVGALTLLLIRLR